MSPSCRERYNYAADRGEGIHRAMMFPTVIKILGKSGRVGIIVARDKEREQLHFSLTGTGFYVS